MHKHDVEPILLPDEKLKQMHYAFMELANMMSEAHSSYKRLPMEELKQRVNKKGAKGFLEKFNLRELIESETLEQDMENLLDDFLENPADFGYLSAMKAKGGGF